GAAARRGAGERPGGARGDPAIGRVAASRHPGARRVRQRPARGAAALLLAARRAIPGDRSMGGAIPRHVGGAPRPFRGRLEKEAQEMKKQITMKRTLTGSLDDIWALWTTKDGIESWWGPEGFETRVAKLELRAGGALEYSFTAVGAAQVEFMRQAQ